MDSSRYITLWLEFTQHELETKYLQKEWRFEKKENRIDTKIKSKEIFNLRSHNSYGPSILVSNLLLWQERMHLTNAFWQKKEKQNQLKWP